MHAMKASDTQDPCAPSDPGPRVTHTSSDAEAEGHLLLELASRITGTLDLQEVLDKSLAAMRELVDFNGGAIQLIEDDHLVAAATDPPISEEAKLVRIPVGRGISGNIAATGKTEYLPDLTVDPRIPEAVKKAGVSGGVRSYFGVPLIIQGFPIGVLQIDSTVVDAFSARERALVLAFTPTITAAVQNAQLFERERDISARLLAADKLKRDFISIVSHELRTPLTIMLGMSGTLVEHAGKLDAERVREFASRTNGAARRLGRLIDDLLYAADLDRGFLGVQRVDTDLGHVLKTFAETADGTPSSVEVDVETDLPTVVADPDRVHQVVSNLVGNAEKYCPPGQPIHIRAVREGNHVAVSVSDHGPGIPVADREAIFELFFQAESLDTRSAGGLGIGLFVVKRLCDAMGADIEVTDTAEGGTRFTIRFRIGEVRPA